MGLTLDLPPEIEQCLRTKAVASGMALDAFAQDILAREAAIPAAEVEHRASERLTGQSLVAA